MKEREIKEKLRYYKEDSVVYRSPELLEAQLNSLKGRDADQYFRLMKERKARFLKRYKLQDDFEL